MDELLKLLKENARETPENLARMLNQSVEEIQRRIQDYEKRGVIRGYQAVVNRDALDSDLVTAVIEVKVTPEREGVTLTSIISPSGSASSRRSARFT